MAKFAGATCAWLVAAMTCALLWNGMATPFSTIARTDRGATDAARADRALHTVIATPTAGLADSDGEVEQEDGEPHAAIHAPIAHGVRSCTARVSSPDDVFTRVDLPPILPAPRA